ncbi:MAG: hypothetical protein ACM3ZF_04900 [Mycobacterium leprae]
MNGGEVVRVPLFWQLRGRLSPQDRAARVAQRVRDAEVGAARPGDVVADAADRHRTADRAPGAA